LTDVFDSVVGASPLVISIPHDGRALAPGQAGRMTDEAKDIPDTDWHVRKLYEFVDEFDASVIAANYSRYVVDLNRSADDAALYPGQLSTGLCPAWTFAGNDIYRDGGTIDDAERANRVEQYWRPYHDKLEILIRGRLEEHGIAILWDAHSISGEVPVLFDGVLPDLNIGTNGGKSCGRGIQDAVEAAALAQGYSSVLNGRFKGGYITRQYGSPGNGVHAVQLEISQRNYMNESTREYDEDAANRLRAAVSAMISAALDSVE
jgi:N-formylglutamate deformylase